ncbi:MAG: hypothetical protein ACKVQA_00175, partial [Burkholderiales bacterium]
MKLHYIVVFAITSLSCSPGQAQDDDEQALKQDAVSRVVESHDLALSVHIGRVYVKQAALVTARELLAEGGKAAGLGQQWNAEAALWKEAESALMQGADELIERKVATPVWIKSAWTDLVAGKFNGEEADEIAVHFQTEGGQLQRRVIEWFVGELTLQTYTFTGRLKYGVPGSEKEMKDLQVVTYDRIFPGVQDFTRYENAVRFASTDPG